MTSLPRTRLPLAACLVLAALSAPLVANPATVGSPDAGQDAVLAVGVPMPGFELEALDGEVLRPGSLQGEAALVLVFFRGAW